MFDTFLTTLSLLPLPFWVVVVLLVAGAVWGFKHMRNGLGLPVLVVLGTTTAWYIVDVFYNDYSDTFLPLFASEALESAWWQVGLFLFVFLVLAPSIHSFVNERGAKRSSQILQMLKTGSDHAQTQLGLQRLLGGCLIVFGMLAVIAIIRLQSQSIFYFFPYLLYRADPWSRGRIGSGLDFAWTIAGHLQLFIAAMFGVMTALLKNPRLRALAALGAFLTWPYFIFDRTRNTMLAAVLPAVLAWVFLRLRINLIQRLLILGFFFFIINAWLAFVISHRSEIAITSALNTEGFDLEANSEIHHEGLNMFEELCWINTFIENGRYSPNWGLRYYAEIVNPIPRSFWPNKPLIGIDYAILRGQAFDEGGATSAGVGATISTGMIGQGVVNFGTILGPAFAALLMSLWVTLLAWLDLHGKGLGRLPLYGLGLILTFNLGRDITLITLYTFVFGGVVVWLVDRGTSEPVVAKPKTSLASQGRARALVPVKTSGAGPFDPNRLPPVKPGHVSSARPR